MPRGRWGSLFLLVVLLAGLGKALSGWHLPTLHRANRLFELDARAAATAALPR